ncbi:MAG: metal-dependent hydrolase [Candidatus Methanomethylicota archaeon]|uniref:UPF0173 metal-dependent hydrolase DRJ20_00615 n=1 Tax=Thermoproteota archaeon TaxID=2056631 RepID=A0A497F8D1_9CREN|nr:MAG: metal-dependent hydrolase [Candidatus Verstraetearchaeota archaeon]RLE55706.1 MAG: metal-dependent hydrolase [Candidatus Verstraetearchaeota archaeon]
MKVRWLGHAGFEIEISEKRILIDPWLTGNPVAKNKPGEFKEVDVILVTHDHGDHLGDAIEIAKNTGAVFVGIYELSQYALSQGVKDTVGMNIGGSTIVKDLKVIMVPAFHSCERGAPVGFVIQHGDESVYHAGDTSLFADMKLIGELYKPKLALLPIGSHFTMGPLEAAKATELIKPKVVIPMHYNTFPVIKQDPHEFEKLVKKFAPDVKVIVAEVGKWIEI